MCCKAGAAASHNSQQRLHSRTQAVNEPAALHLMMSCDSPCSLSQGLPNPLCRGALPPGLVAEADMPHPAHCPGHCWLLAAQCWQPEDPDPAVRKLAY